MTLLSLDMQHVPTCLYVANTFTWPRIQERRKSSRASQGEATPANAGAKRNERLVTRCACVLSTAVAHLKPSAAAFFSTPPALDVTMVAD